MSDRQEIHTDGSFIEQTAKGGWAAVVVRAGSGQQDAGSSYEMELRAIVEAAKMADGQSTVISDHQGIVNTARQGKTPTHCKALWEELHSATAGKDVTFEWRPRDKSLGSRLAHQLARDAAKGR